MDESRRDGSGLGGPPFALVVLGTLALAACGARTGIPEPEARPTSLCGDMVEEAGEQCDDGNASNADACVAGCKLARCGDGLVRVGFEACDDGNIASGDGCQANCALASCGDGHVDPGEECDDANKNDTDECTSICFLAKCGDGFVYAGFEQCDDGAANGDHPAFLLTQKPLQRSVMPVDRPKTPAAFYDYFSASGHTGFEAVGQSRLFLYRDTTVGSLSLFVEHGIDHLGGPKQPASDVGMVFDHLPATSFVALSDDDKNELAMQSATTAVGTWHFDDNTDGGVIAGLPFPGAWSIDVAPIFAKGVDGWTYVEADGSFTPLVLTAVAHLTAFAEAGTCRLDCTVPRCGDGIIDGGEVCDDGNTVSGDGCAADCKSLT